MESSENKNAGVSPAHEPDASPKAVKMSENKMGTMPVPKLLVSMSLPMVASMLVQALYNVVDSIFVSKFDQAAMTAVTLAFPAQTLLIASAVGTGVGINALLSYNLGKKDQKGVNNAASHGIFLYTLYAVIFCVLGFTLAGPFIRSQFAAKDFADNYDLTMKTIGYGKDYLSIVMGCSVHTRQYCQLLIGVLAGQILLIALLFYEGFIECNNLVNHMPILLNFVVLTGQSY